MGTKRRRFKTRRPADDPARSPLTEEYTRHLGAICLAITLFVFLPALGNDFVNWDDDRNFLENPHYRGLSLDNLRWMFTTFHLGHYHPLTWLTLGLDYAVWGMNPVGYHATNVLLHALTTLLVYFVILRLLLLARRAEEDDDETPAMRLAAAFGALWFALHPLRVESVVWVSERRDVLSGFFAVASVLFYLRGKKAASVAVFVAALLSKIIVAVVPVALLALDFYPLRRKFDRRLLIDKIPYVVPALAAGLFALSRQRTGLGGTFADVAVEPMARVTMSLYGAAFYLWKTLVPFGLAPQYAWRTVPDALDPILLLGGGVAIAVTGAVTWAAVRRGMLGPAVAWFSYIVVLLPVLSLLRYDPQQFVADHHSYLATLGFAALGAALFLRWFTPERSLLVGGCALAFTLLLCERTVAQIGVWRDSTTLWTHTLSVSPSSIVARNNLGRVLAREGKTDAAVEHFREAIRIQPEYAHARYNLGNVLMQADELAEAEQHFRVALAREPEYAEALNGLANCLVRQRREAEAETYYQRAIEAQPGFARAHYNLGIAFHQQGKLDDAERQYRRTTEIDPTNAGAHNNWGILLERQGRAEEAIPHYRRALAIEPNHQAARRNLDVATGASRGGNR